jgi:hypothetical protein
MEILNNMVMHLNSLNAKRFNSDYDGDGLGCYSLHSTQAKKEARRYMTPISNIQHEHNLEMVDTLEHESIQAAYMLSLKGWKNFDSNKIELTLQNISEFQADINTVIKTPNIAVRLIDEDIVLPYNSVLINASFDIEELIYTDSRLLYKKNLLELIKLLYDFVENAKFHDKLHNFNKVLLECSTVVSYCNTSFELNHFAVNHKAIEDFKKTLINEPFTGFHQNQMLFDTHVKNLICHDEDNILTNVFNSGARIKNVQLLKAASNNGIPTDINGRAFKHNIKNSLLDGLTEEEFFMTGDSARLALAQRQDSIPKGGELQRKIYFTTGFLQLNNIADCGSEKYFTIVVSDRHHLASLYGRWYITDDNPKLRFVRLDDTKLIGTEIKVRSPIYCKSGDYAICDRCFGSKKPDSDNIGAAIGSYIAESIIQSILRTHHFSGAFITEIKKEFNEIIESLQFESPNIIKGSPENIDRYKQYLLDNYYKEEDFTITKTSKNCYEIDVINLPLNDDSVKKLQVITSYIDKNRDSDNLISPEEIYKFLKNEIIMPNDILSIYVELIIGILFYDEDGIMIRYSDKEINFQLALKNVISHIDPRMSFFYGFNDGKISDCYDAETEGTVLKHMYQDLTDIYY